MILKKLEVQKSLVSGKNKNASFFLLFKERGISEKDRILF
jgi:hypothetical protein